MIPTTRGWLNILRLGLLTSAIGWGISFYFTFASWTAATDQLYRMGAGPITYHPLFNYWLRMASSVFGCIGVGSAIACARPQAFAGFIRMLGPFHFVIGITLSIAAYASRLTPQFHPTFIPDIVFCFLAGMLIQLPILHEGQSIRNAQPRTAATGSTHL